MEKLDLIFLKKDILNIRFQNIEEIILMVKYCLVAYAKSVISFGFKHSVTSEVVRVWKEFLSIVIEEKNLLNKIVEYGLFVDVDEVYNFLDELDDLNEETILYYYRVLDDIETACEMGDSWRATRPKRDFRTLIEIDEYRKKLYALTLSLENVKEFLGYEEDFWIYIKTRVLFLDSHFEEDNDFYGVNIKLDDSNFLIDMKVLVPRIINLETALVNVHEFNHAYYLYKTLGYPIVNDDIFYEEMTKSYENLFQDEYVKKKYKKFFGKVIKKRGNGNLM